jgi:acetylornithine deacetylase/succinyl-diaminopimelate desuccinylase-like protein
LDGVNPIRHAALAVLALDRSLDRFHPQVGYGIISPNIINGGHFVSSVPAECSIVVDRRILPGETDETALEEAEGWIREALRDNPEARFEIAPLIDANKRKRYSPPNVTEWDSPIVQSLVRAHERITERKAEPFVDWFGVTDGRLFRYQGIGTAAYGPTGAHFHGSNEYVDVSALVTQLRVFVDVAFQTLGAN